METNKKLIGVFIKATPENRQELKEFWEANSEDAKRQELAYNATTGCNHYGLYNKSVFTLLKEEDCLNQGYKILTLPEAKALIQEKPYPKVMWVWDKEEDKKKAYKAVIIGETANWFVGYYDIESIEDINPKDEPSAFRYAKDIEELPIIELTLEDIAKLKGCEVEQLKIKA